MQGTDTCFAQRRLQTLGRSRGAMTVVQQFNMYLPQIIYSLFKLIGHAMLILGIATAGFVGVLSDFMARTEADARATQPPRDVVVFTGAYDRVDLGLEMIALDQADRLLITGANRTSGLLPHKYPQLFNPTSEQAEWVRSGRIVLAPNALSTFENALETVCWLQSLPDVEAVTLITSRRHMARASLVLDRAIDIPVVRLPPDPQAPYELSRHGLKEFRNFVGSWLITLLPKSMWPSKNSTNCEAR